MSVREECEYDGAARPDGAAAVLTYGFSCVRASARSHSCNLQAYVSAGNCCISPVLFKQRGQPAKLFGLCCHTLPLHPLTTLLHAAVSSFLLARGAVQAPPFAAWPSRTGKRQRQTRLLKGL